jgi:hypothetical protein
MGEFGLNFVEIMALSRAFSVGVFKCSKVSPKIIVADILGDGYVLKIPKRSAKKYCLHCVRSFFNNGKLEVTEDKKYLTIRSL